MIDVIQKVAPLGELDWMYGLDLFDEVKGVFGELVE